MTTRSLAAAVLTLALTGVVTSGCSTSAADQPQPERANGTTPAESTGDDTAASTHPIEVTDGLATDDLLSCLGGAGLEAVLDDSTPYGVEVPTDTVRVLGMTGYDGGATQSASLYVFADPAAAEENAPLVVIDYQPGEDNPRTAVHGNVLRSFNIVTATPPTDDEAALLACLPR